MRLVIGPRGLRGCAVGVKAMSSSMHTGRCLCGGVRYAAVGDVKDLCVCHCESCRRATGGLMVPWGTVSPARFTVTRGQLAEFRSSPDVVRGFCAACGTTLTYRHAQRADEVDFALTGDRRCMVEDRWGNTWQVATRLAK